MKKFRMFLKEGLILSAITLPFFVWILRRYIHLDFWYDELFSFDCFVFVPLQKTITDYGAPNNHIFFNILSNIYVTLLGIKDLFMLMDTPYKIRLLPLTYSTITLVYVYLTGKKFFNRSIGYLALLVLVTTIPFYNFAVQVRGYSLSMTFASMIIYYVWSFGKTAKWSYAAGIVLCTVLILYTIPLNIYFLIGMVIFYCIAGFFQYAWPRLKNRANKEPSFSLKVLTRQSFYKNYPYFAIVGLLVLAIAIATLIYLPFYRSFINNRHFKSHGLFNWDTLFHMMPQSLFYFFSQRYLFIPITILGLVMCLVPAIRRKHQDVAFKWGFCAVTVGFPFILSCIRGDHPPSRAFVNLAPLFALFIAVSFYFIIRILPKTRVNALLLSGIIIYCHVTFANAVYRKDAYIKLDVIHNRNTYDMYYNYFQAYYHPSKLVSDFLRNYPTDTIPITLVLNSEEYEIRRYLDKFQVKYFLDPYRVLFNSQGQAYVVTAFTDKFEEKLFQVIPQVRCQKLNEDINYHNILLCKSPFLMNH